MTKIFCIDDDAVTLMYYSALIKKNYPTFEIETAINGQEAIDYYKSLFEIKKVENYNYPKYIFLDLNMPIMNGWEFLDEFMKSYITFLSETKVIILTSSIDPRDKERALVYSIPISFYSKPLTQEILNEVIKSSDS